MRLTLAILLLPLVAFGQSFTVTVSSNGVIRFPTNLFSANSNALVAVTGTGGGGGGGSTLTVNGGATVASPNFQTSARISYTLTGSDITADIVADSITTNHTSAAFETFFRDRGSHTGTQLLSTISDAGTAATKNFPTSGNAASGEVVLGSDTRLTDARTPSAHTHPATAISDSTTAGRALLTAADAAAQRTALAVTNLLPGTGIQFSGVDITHNIEAGANITLTTNSGALVITGSAGGGGTTNLVSSSANGLAPQITSANAVLSSDGSSTPVWLPRNTRLMSWTALENNPPTNASSAALFTLRGDGIPAVVFTNNTAREANFTGWLPSGVTLTNGLDLVVAAYSEGATGSSNVVLQAQIMRLCCTGSGALDTNAFLTASLATSTLPTTVSVATNITISMPTITDLTAGEMIRVQLTRVVGSASDTNDFNLGVLGARLEAR